MMDPATARLALRMQLDDVDAILKSLPQSGNDANAKGEKAAFEALRSELVKKWDEVHGQVYAYSILQEENANRLAFKRLLDEEQQAERDHEMACRLAGKAVPKRPTASNKRPANGEVAAEQKAQAVNGIAPDNKKLRINLDGIQTAGAQPQPQTSKKRPAEGQLVPRQKDDTAKEGVLASKRARVDDEDEEQTTTQPRSTTPKKRVAFVDPAGLREDEDGRTMRARLEEPFDWSRLGLCGVVKTSPTTGEASSSDKDKSAADCARQHTCSSCLELYHMYDMLQLPCKDEEDIEPHAYCRDCLRRLFESSVTDPSHFPPRCCSKIIPLFSCTLFLPQELIARFVARREELETPNRTYCSNTKCSMWIRPANVVAGVATCSVCSQKTCATCKSKQHEGLCPEDKGVKELMSVAQQKRWQTCPNCKEMVELERGCYHITCRCHHEFCYRCVAKWKTCQCPTWDENNIIDRPQGANNAAQPVVNAAAPAVAAPPAPLPQPAVPANQNAARAQAPARVPVQQQHQPQVGNIPPAHRRAHRRNRRNNHAHVHDFERYYRSEGWNTECQECDHEDRWVNCCFQCGLRVCWYCTKHRVYDT